MRKLFLTYIALMVSALAWAQQGTSVSNLQPYECSFEESEDLSAWMFNNPNPTAPYADQWMVGTAVHSEGKRSLYISCNGQDPRYGGKPNTIVAYLRYKFPTEATTQRYDLSFDWRGIGDSLHSRLYVMVCPESQLTTANSAYNLNAIVSSPSPGRLSNAQIGACEALGESGEKFVCGSETWQNVTLTRSISVSPQASGMNFAIVFLWVSDNQTDSLGISSIAIDNVQINSAALQKPQDLDAVPQCEDSTMLVTWVSPGAANEFDIAYRKVGTTAWRQMSVMPGSTGFVRYTDNDGIVHCSYVLTRILEGSYDVRVRGSFDGDLRTGYVYKSNILMYCPENHCINYIDLHNPSVICTYGHHPGAQAGATPYDNIGIIDFGPDAEESRHTLHIDPTELDPRTDSMLHTVPDGALASVRLGNWKWGGEAESITYDITVDTTNQGILIVKYAVVFENPGDHPREDEPAFKLEVGIPGPNGELQLIDALCGQKNFTYSSSGDDPDHWHITKDGNVAWKDWTSAGLDLMRYHGQTIKVRFTTLDCGWSGHFAYAYFVVDCANAHIETENCGNDPYLTCKAPDGFAYEWRDENDVIWGNDQVLSVDAGLHTYTCRVSFLEESSCYFEISTVSAPRFPVPEYTYENIREECNSTLKITNTSHVMHKFEGYETHTSEQCNEYHWEFRNIDTGEKRVYDAFDPSYPCPKEGGRIEVTYTCYIGANNSCDSTRVDTIIVPNILSEPTDFHYISCSENPIKFDNQWFNTDTVYTATFTNEWGCDSVSTLYLKVYPQPKDKYLHDSICSDGYVTIGGKKYNEQVENLPITLKTENGCDSMVFLTLTVNERIKAEVDYLSYACADEEAFFITYDIQAGQYDSLRIAFSTPDLKDTTIYDPSVNRVAIPYSPDIQPGHYMATLTFYQFCCGKHVEQRAIDVRYSSSIVEQKWNDVLTLLAPKYNGGYEFTAVQWYKNDVPLTGETHTYLYQPLDFEAEYYAVVTRADGVQIATCPLTPVPHEDQTPYPTVVKAGQHMRMFMEREVTVWYYTVSGQLYSSFTMSPGFGTLQVPAQPGAYVIKTLDAQGNTQAQVMLVE